MKKYVLMSAVGMMMLAACSDDESVAMDKQAPPSLSEITLSLNSGGDGLNTRANRPVNSSEAANNVTKVQIYIYAPSGTDVTAAALSAGTANPLAWTAGPSNAATPGTDDHKASQTIKLNKLATDGTYTVVVYGYNDVADYTVTGGGSAADAFTATLPGATVSELFAGRATFEVENGNLKGGTTSEVELKRQVAGLLGYFKNIPVKYPDPNASGAITTVKYIRVYASSASSAFTFPSAMSVNATGNDTKTKVLEYDLSILPDYATQVSAAGSDLTKKFTIAAGTGSVATVVNSLVSGKFLIPFSAVTNTPTFTIQLEANEVSGNSPVLKSWKVVNSAVSSGDKSVYDVQRNYFYSIGTKNLSATTDGGTSDPGTTGDDDQPIDLSQETVITVTVNDAWDVIYNLGLE